MTYTASGVVRDPTTLATVGSRATVYAYRRDTGAAAPTASKAVGSDGTFNFSDFVDDVEYDVFADLGAGRPFPVPTTIRRQVKQSIQITHASTASNGAGAVIQRFAPFGGAGVRIKEAYWSPTGGDQATHGTASTSASYRRLQVLNGGTAGTNTTNIIASLNITASIASLGTKAFTSVDTTNTVASNEIVYVSQLTVGGDDNEGTVLRAGSLSLTYELI